MTTTSPDDTDTPSPTALDGEDPEHAQIGIMYSERTWVVRPWMKAVSFWVFVASIGGMGVQGVQKRNEFRGLLVDSVVEPEAWGNAPAPDIVLNASYRDGKEGGGAVKLSDFKGKWVFVNFWATWCAPCRDEMPSMEMLNRRFGKELVMMAVSVDDDQSQIARFFGAEKPSFIVLWDRDKQFTTTYGSRKFPESYLISPDGRIAAKFVGPRDWYNQGTVQYFTDVLAGKRKPVG